MKRFAGSLISVLLLISSLGWTSPVNAYSGVNHEEITRHALGYHKVSGDVYEYKFSKVKLMYDALKGIGIDIDDQEEQEDIAAKIEEGSKEEDSPATRCLNHFYDPTKPVEEAGLTDIFTGDPSILWAQDTSQWPDGKWSWPDARDYYFKALTLPKKKDRDKYLKETFCALGHILHLLQDADVPAHTRNDAHPKLGDWDVFGEKDYYEWFCRDPKIEGKPVTLNYDGYPVVVFDKLKPESEDYVKFEDFWDTDLRLDAFGKGLAEYTNHNFVSRHTNLDVTSGIHYYTHPVKTGYHHEPFTFEDKHGVERTVNLLYLKSHAEDKYEPNRNEDLDYLTAFSFWNFYTGKYGHKPVYTLNSKCHEAYANLLLPRAAGYSAGLLNYFFRGKLDFELKCVEGPYLNFVVTNRSRETITGTLALYWDDKNGNRSKVEGAEWSVDLARNEAFYPTYTLPDNAMRCIWVFQGTLDKESPETAEEKGAVIGKVVELAPMSYAITLLPPKHGHGSPPEPILTYHSYFGTLALSLTNVVTFGWHPGVDAEFGLNIRDTGYKYLVHLTPDNPAIPIPDKFYTVGVSEYVVQDDWWSLWKYALVARGIWGGCDRTYKEYNVIADGLLSVGDMYEEIRSELPGDLQHYFVPRHVYINNSLYPQQPGWLNAIPKSGARVILLAYIDSPRTYTPTEPSRVWWKIWH